LLFGLYIVRILVQEHSVIIVFVLVIRAMCRNFGLEVKDLYLLPCLDIFLGSVLVNPLLPCKLASAIVGWHLLILHETVILASVKKVKTFHHIRSSLASVR